MIGWVIFSRADARSPVAVRLWSRIGAGTVIFLNGTSSSGKGTIARALQESVDELFLHVEMDFIFEAMEIAGYNGAVRLGDAVPPKLARGAAFIHDGEQFVRIEYGDEGRRAFQGYFGMVAALADSGNNVIADAFLDEAWMLPNAAVSFAEGRAFLVGLRCDLGELERREQERGDRFPGIARAFAESVHRHVPFYDIEVDTGSSSVEASVNAISLAVSSGKPRAFKALRDGLSTSDVAGAIVEG
jgi:chloramphenicol 3-O phosphotransferase